MDKNEDKKQVDAYMEESYDFSLDDLDAMFQVEDKKSRQKK